MKTAALIANIGLLVTMAWYLVTISRFEAEGLELVAIALTLVAPILSILALVTGRAADGGSKPGTGAPRPAGQG